MTISKYIYKMKTIFTRMCGSHSSKSLQITKRIKFFFVNEIHSKVIGRPEYELAITSARRRNKEKQTSTSR